MNVEAIKVTDLVPGDLVNIYGDVVVEVLKVEPAATGIRLCWRQHYPGGGSIDGRYLLGEYRLLPRLIPEDSTAVGSHPTAAERAAEHAQIGA